MFSVVVGVQGLVASQSVRFPSRALAAALIAVIVGVIVQLAPISPRVLTTLSPSSLTADYRQLYAKATMRPTDVATGSASHALRPMSIAPSRTVLGLIFLVALIVLLVGTTRAVSTVGSVEIARGTLALGVLVALVALAQHAQPGETLYGFWYPPRTGIQVSAPFINRNHTAGWLLMAWGLSAGYLGGCLARRLRGATPGWRRLVSSADASETLLTGFALVVMATTIIVTVSRSGFLCLVSAIVLFGGWLFNRQEFASRRAVGAVILVFALVMGAAWGGVDAVLRRFQVMEPGFGGRLGIWQDTLRIIHDFPLVGTGLNTYGIAMLQYQTVVTPANELIIEAHNDYLQIVAEGGLLLSVPVLIALALFIREVWRRFRERNDDMRTYWIRAGAVTGLCAIAMQELSDFTLQMPGATVLFVILAAIAIHRPLHRSADSSSGAVNLNFTAIGPNHE